VGSEGISWTHKCFARGSYEARTASETDALPERVQTTIYEPEWLQLPHTPHPASAPEDRQKEVLPYRHLSPNSKQNSALMEKKHREALEAAPESVNALIFGSS
jgi:hypothetical protein